MATPTLAQARSHYARQRKVGILGARSAVTTWRKTRSAAAVARVVTSYQYASAATSVRTIAGWAGASEPLTFPEAFAGYTSEGFRVEDALAPLIDDLTAQVEAGLAEELHRIDRAAQSLINDAGRTASQVEFVARPDWQNYVRMLTPPSCSRCAILAGRVYRDLDWFLRHPGCDCVMVPVQSWQDAHDSGLVSSFEDAFRAGNVTGLSKADARAIRDGADPIAIVNTYRGTSAPGITGATANRLPHTVTLTNPDGTTSTYKATTEGVTKRSEWRRANPDKRYRLRPEGIYQWVDDKFGHLPDDRRREIAVQQLRNNGYIRNEVPSETRKRTALADAAPQPSPAAPATDAAGSGQPPRPPAPPTPAASAPDPSDKRAWDAYWKARQDAIPLDFKGDVLTADEVPTVERLVSRGEEIDWIPRTPRTSTNDFIWLNRGGVEIEMKSSKARYKTIHGRIVDAASRAYRNHEVIKDRFLIDIGSEVLTDALRSELARFNVGRLKYLLAGLWVMSQDGEELEQIDLEK